MGRVEVRGTISAGFSVGEKWKNGDALRNSLRLWNLGLKSRGPEDLTFLGRLAMSRLPRRLQWTEEACYHLMDRGHNREPVFADDEDRHAFLNLVARYQQPFGLRLYHYCLMTNHFHLLLQLDDP